MDIPVCSIKRGTALCKVIQEAKAIVVDEAPMTNRHAIEALDRTLGDLTGNSRPMGGICMLLCGGFSHILPVILHGTRGNIVDACLKKSHLWDSVVVKHLQEFLNSSEVSGLPPHLLPLKVGVPIINLRSLDPPRVMNSTRCVITKLSANTIEAKLSHGRHAGHDIIIPWIPLIATPHCHLSLDVCSFQSLCALQ